MSMFDPALMKQVREMYSSDPLAAYFVKMMEEKAAADKKKKEEENAKFKPPKFSVLQMIALSPFVAMIGTWVLNAMWNHTLTVLGVVH